MSVFPHRSARLLPTLLLLAATAFTVTAAQAPAARADGIRDSEWALEALHAGTAWRTTRGEGVTVAVIDTGVDSSHPDLQGQVLKGKDMVGFGARAGDGSWARHGTSMAGIIAGRGHGFGGQDGITGIAPRAKILPVRVILDDGDPQRRRARATRGSALPQGIRWATDHGADVINLSLGDDSKSSHPEREEDRAIQYALGKGVVVVASAGNGGKEGDRASYPAAYPGVIPVTAVDRLGNRGDFSTRRWYTSVAAPGVDVVIADPDRHYYEGWGTSAAAAYVSGSVALIRSAYPELGPAQIKRLLEATARNTPRGGRSDAVGTGLVDPAAALERARVLTPQPPVPSVSAYPHRYFGAGPDTARADASGAGGMPGLLVKLCAAAGLALCVAAGVLHLRGRRGRRAF
ncbi:type VII secretion-associated serine protease mycosin [Wenjunlia tyrosinilytica]|uniref:Type VII secretion-associated serine protease n=1 Tax=Wenjunlia tyrosinilytica TaxID=1544741 RepID=A0A917ZGT5_9ACTN|nr:type VII secretion-associated serine protease mycosin [Wenjunlia tyrosinilytica]GGO82720.1 type VII secretion-associated serine protease [Wenjunlia tyrosinilytica]